MTDAISQTKEPSIEVEANAEFGAAMVVMPVVRRTSSRDEDGRGFNNDSGSRGNVNGSWWRRIDFRDMSGWESRVRVLAGEDDLVADALLFEADNAWRAKVETSAAFTHHADDDVRTDAVGGQLDEVVIRHGVLDICSMCDSGVAFITCVFGVAEDSTGERSGGCPDKKTRIRVTCVRSDDPTRDGSQSSTDDRASGLVRA